MTPKLLVVSVDEVFRSRLGELLTEAGYEHDAAETGRAGYELMIIDRDVADSLDMLAELRRRAVMCLADLPPSFEDTVQGAVANRLGEVSMIDH
ncbi:hypothetical protein ACFQ1S_30540, partial [Kibdelosporangium lantanae]